MMEKIIISVEKSTRMVSLTKTTIGNDLENLQQELVFKFTDQFVNGSARLEYKIGSEKHHIPMTQDGETYTVPIKNVITKEGKIEMQLVIVEAEQNEEIPVFKSNVFYVYCNKSINAQTEEPDDYEYWLDVIQTKLASIDEALEEVDNLDIDASKSGNVATVTITKKDGTSESVEINDGQDGSDGEDAKINGYNTVTIEAGTNINLQQEGNVLTIENTYDDSDIVSDIADLKDVDIDLQNQIDAITSSSDVVDIVGTYQELQNYDTTKLTEDDVVKVLQDSTHNNALSYYRWSSNAWEYIGSEGPFYTKGETDALLNEKQNTINNSNKLNADLVDDINTTNKFVTSEEKTFWNNKYEQPLTGIPKTDLSNEVQTSLGKADTAVQDVSGKEDKTNKVTTIDENSTNSQYPSAKCVYDSQQAQDEELEKYKTLYNAMPKLKGTGTDITIDDTAETMLKMDLSGNTYQYSTTGKNSLNDNSFTETTSFGVTITPYFKNGLIEYININGVFDSDQPQNVRIGTFTATQGSTYYLSGLTGWTYNTLQLWGDKGSVFPSGNRLQCYNGIGSATAQASDTVPIVIYMYPGQTYNNVKIYPMITTTNNDTYEPYTNGPTPRPDYPQNIEVVTGDNEIKVSNKENLFNINNISESIYLNTGGGTGPSTASNVSDYIEIIGGETYNLSFDYSTLIGSGDRAYCYYNSSKTLISGDAYGLSNKTKTFNTPANAKYIRFCYDKNMTDILFIKGSSATEYQSQTYPINLGNLELCKIGDYKDSIIYQNNKWYKHAEIGKLICNGSENWEPDAYGTNPYQLRLSSVIQSSSSNDTRILAKATQFKGTSVSARATSGNNVIYVPYGTHALCLRNTDFATTDSLKAHFNSNNMIVYYVLKTLTDTEITDATLINQLEAIKDAMAHQDQTNISQTNDEQPFIIDYETLYDMQKLVTRVATLEAE